MVAQPASVPAARLFVGDVLAGWGRDGYVDEVGLCVTELVTNAVLHSGSAYFHVDLEERAGAIDFAVADAGMGPVDRLARQAEFSEAGIDDLTVESASATGRGMLLVSALATVWGIDELPVGKRIWGRFSPGQTGSDAELQTSTAARTTTRGAPTTLGLDPDSWAVVRFRGCPAALLVAHDENLDDYTRELQLIGHRLHEPSFQRLAGVLGGYVADHAPNWDPARIVAREAVRDGRESVDFDVLSDTNIRASLGVLRRLIEEAEALSHAGTLMTLPAAEPVQRLRDWLEGEFLAQIEDGAEPLPYPDWLAGVRR